MAEKQHLIAIDLDGTLLNNKHSISDKNKQMIQLAMQQGHIVVIATGRSFRMSRYYYNELNLNTPIVNANGAVLHHPLNKNWGFYHNPFERDIALDIIDLSYQANIQNIIAKVDNSIYLDKHDDQILKFFKPTLEDYPLLIGNVKQELKENPTIMLLYPDEQYQVDLLKQIEQAYPDEIQLRNWGPPMYILEIMRQGLNKAEALSRIADYYQIPQNRIIAFGDEGNDLAMIDYAGVGVAMENAIDELKSIANYVTTTNEASGVGTFLNDYLQLHKQTL